MIELAHTARLPAPLTEKWDWQRRAACRGMDVAAFFHPAGERGIPWREREERAKQVCARCPVQQECLDYALRIEEPFGTWGGLDEQQRWELVLQRRRAARNDRHPRADQTRRALVSRRASEVADDGDPVPRRRRRGPRR